MTQQKQKSIIDFSGLVNNLMVGVCRYVPKGKGDFLFVNPAFGDILGYKTDELMKINVSRIFETRKSYQEFIRKITKEDIVKNEEVRLERKDGNIVWGSITARAVKDGRGKLIFIDGNLKDISHRKQVERELIESKELFRVVFDNSAVAITVTDKEEKIIAWNPFAEKVLDMTKEDLFNKSVKELYPPREWRRMRSMRIRRREMISGVETQVIKKDGSVLDVSVSISVLKDAEGNVTGSIGIMRDITQQKEAERKLRESENKTRVILEHAAAAITLIDKEERIISWNKFTEHLLGMKKKDLYMKPVSFLYPRAEWKKIRAENIRRLGSRHHLETKIIRKDGKLIDVDLSINVLKDTDGHIVGSVGMMQDITEYKRATKMLLEAKVAAEEANSAKSMFLANMSHEVRTPMNAIIGMIDMTLDTDLDEEQQDNLKTAKDAADNLLGLLNDILDLSRVEAGKITLESIDFNLRNILKSVHKGLLVLARKKNLDFHVEIKGDVPELIEGDPVRIRQIIINLVNNAIKFTEKGAINIKVGVASRMKNECQLQFSVSDTGIGIPKDKLEAIFEPFTQADDSTTRRFGGTGLGLAISQRLVEMMGGRIWVESDIGKGSRFNFTTVHTVKKKGKLEPITITTDMKGDKVVPPIYAREKEKGDRAGIKEQKPHEMPQPSAKKLKILLAEDNIVNQKIAVKMLEKQGWDVTAVIDGKEVLDLFEKEKFDLILMDVQMPVLDGLKTTQEIRAIEQRKGGHLPIIAMTAHAMEGDEQRCLDAGMDDYVSKPIDRNKLFNAIENINTKT